MLASIISLAGGAWIMLAFLITFVAVLAYAFYSRRGSGIDQRPYVNVYDQAPGAKGESRMTTSSDRAINVWTRGTR